MFYHLLPFNKEDELPASVRTKWNFLLVQLNSKPSVKNILMDKNVHSRETWFR